ncbi:MAG: hypothetical protein ACLQF1_11555 [Methyloceanibacter sp.]
MTTPNPSPVLLPGLFRNTHWGAAFDVRGLDQDLQIHGSTAGASDLFNYRESLDTTYYGGYLTFGGEYSIFPSLYSGWGLRSFADVHVGLYDANVDYNGRFAGNGVGPNGLGLSEDNLAVIAGPKFETRKQFSPRTSVSLLSEYDWYSFVPGMRYNDGDGKANGIVNQTHITDDDAFLERTSLRLNIGLGPSQLYVPPMK